MSAYTWTFVRDDHHLAISQAESPDGLLLVVTHDNEPRSYLFASSTALTRFQADMEAFLLNTGWRFLAFSPERRGRRDRRTFPRLAERRRWWTDGTIEMNKVVWGG